MFSKGAASFISLRELKYLHAHGDTMPRRPVRQEARTTRATIEPRTHPGRLVNAFNDRMVALVAHLENNPPGGPIRVAPSRIVEQPATQTAAAHLEGANADVPKLLPEKLGAVT